MRKYSWRDVLRDPCESWSREVDITMKAAKENDALNAEQPLGHDFWGHSRPSRGPLRKKRQKCLRAP